eukprot:4871359-Pyramimonas_sp.AAC.1
MKTKAKTCGRLCGICGAKDTDPDPCSPGVFILWGGYKKTKGKTGQDVFVLVELETEGAVCWYCYRVWNVHYMISFNLTELKKKVGSCHQTSECFNRFRAWLVEYVIKRLEVCDDRDQIF